MGRITVLALLLAIGVLTIEKHANAINIQNVASSPCQPLVQDLFEEICTNSQLDERCENDGDCVPLVGPEGKCCTQPVDFLMSMGATGDISMCGRCAPQNQTCCDVIFIGPSSVMSESTCNIFVASCPPSRPHCQPPPSQSSDPKNDAPFQQLAATPEYFSSLAPGFYEGVKWCSLKPPCGGADDLCSCNQCDDTNLANPCSRCGDKDCSTFDGSVTTDTAVIGFLALISFIAMSVYVIVLWRLNRHDAPFPEPFDVMSNTNRIWRLITIFNPLYFANLFIFYGRDFTFVSRIVTILIFQVLLGFTISGMYRSEDEADKSCVEDTAENAARVFSVATIIPIWQYFFNVYVMKPKLVADESLFKDRGLWLNVPYLSYVFYGLIVLGGIITTIIGAIFTGNRDLLIRWLGGLTVMTFIVSPAIGLASGFLLKEFDEKSIIQPLKGRPDGGARSSSKEEPGSKQSQAPPTVTGHPLPQENSWNSQPTHSQTSRGRDGSEPLERNSFSSRQQQPPPPTESNDNPFSSSDNPFA